MVGVNNVSLFFADRALFNDINFIINKQDRIGLVGKNGAGKSTMLKALAKIQKIDSGTISTPTGLTMGYLPQDMDFVSGRTVWNETETSFSETLSIKNKIDVINHQLAVREDYESESYLKLLDDLSELNEKLILLGIDTMEAEIEKILLGLGFTNADFERQTDEFSGGWRMRIELAKILLQKSDLLLLDEPTNHLDIESIQWLEDFLKSYPGAVVLISHDRAFLDNLTNRTIEITLGRIYDYPAPYTKYLELRKERREQELAAYSNQQKQIKQTEEFIDRFRAKATKAVQVQSRIKQLNRLDRIEIEVEDTSAMRFSFPPAPHSGKVSLLAENVGKFYGDKEVFSNVNLSIERGEKVAFVGKNGEGKSTFSRLIIGEKLTQGKIDLGFQVQIGYYAQNQAEILDKEKTVFQVIDDVARGDVRTKVRALLGSFLFSGEEVDKKVKVLSGGERARLALCKLMLEPINLLILDEPTNHLDIKSKDILKDALLRYDGTLIIISHDRDFLKGLTDKLYEFSNKNVKEHLGGIEAFLKKKSVEDFKEWEQEKKPKVEKQPHDKNANINLYQVKKDLKKEVRTIQNSLNTIEKKIANLEKELEVFNEKLKEPEAYSNPNNRDMIEKWQQTNDLLQQHMKKWESVAIELEESQEKLNELD
ncbi:MAG: ABC transporter ATP-binding protein [Bacteroidetes bacterium]|nr:MAG: ABC transporter ATP-binding protein [Bacteroidota bacterium]MBL1145933.1 ABC transporter ATP-binding protein [Bacteroidota bacterium]NOG58727.1 ABC-F family ATP-binding cassette domain-containing protein [Bacteroidota bacterium]